MTRVLGFELAGENRAYTLDRLIAERVINDTLEGIPVAVFWKAGTASAVDARTIQQGRDVGTTGVFQRMMGDQVLTFEPGVQGGFVDMESGSTWDILGLATAGPLTGTQLVPVPHHDTFWFAWAAFVPEGTIAE
jgi:hypothetical protein